MASPGKHGAAALALALACTATTAFDLQGHRGARGLAPENTIAAFAAALRVGVTTLELDTGITRDGVVVVMHDRRLNPDLARDEHGRWTAGLRLADHGGSVPRLVQAVGARAWSPSHRNLSEASLKEAHALGLAVLPWTVNEPADIERMLGWGVDGLISDHPDRVRDAMARRGMPLPATVPVPR